MRGGAGLGGVERGGGWDGVVGEVRWGEGGNGEALRVSRHTVLKDVRTTSPL